MFPAMEDKLTWSHSINEMYGVYHKPCLSLSVTECSAAFDSWEVLVPNDPALPFQDFFSRFPSFSCHPEPRNPDCIIIPCTCPARAKPGRYQHVQKSGEPIICSETDHLAPSISFVVDFILAGEPSGEAVFASKGNFWSEIIK